MLSPTGQQRPALIADLVSLHWSLPPQDDPIWPVLPRLHSRDRLDLAVGAAAATLGGAVAASQSGAAHRYASAASSRPPGRGQCRHRCAPALPQPYQHPRVVFLRGTTHVPVAEHAARGYSRPAYTRNDSAQPTVDRRRMGRHPVPARPPSGGWSTTQRSS